jgi:hypothetical protein
LPGASKHPTATAGAVIGTADGRSATTAPPTRTTRLRCRSILYERPERCERRPGAREPLAGTTATAAVARAPPTRHARAPKPHHRCGAGVARDPLIATNAEGIATNMTRISTIATRIGTAATRIATMMPLSPSANENDQPRQCCRG